MQINKISILFLLQRNRVNKQGKCPTRCRITYNGKRKIFSIGLFINPSFWYSKLQKVKPPNKENDIINTQLSLIKNNINQAFLLLQIQEKNFDVEDIYLQYKGENIKTDKTLLEVFKMHNERMLKLIGMEYSKATYSKFIEARTHTLNFIKFQYKKSDFLLSNLNMKFLNDFDFYLKSEKNHKQITINKSIQRLRKIVKLALSEGYLQNDPFLQYKPKRVIKKVVYLTVNELKELEEYQFSQKRLQQVKDMFIFCCYTGLAYLEMSTLSKEHIVKGFDGNDWIQMYRTKTKSDISIPLLPKAKEILDKYDNALNAYNALLPVISNQKFNSYLKEIAEIVGIDKRLTHHIARKTFATTVLLYNDVPMEIVSKLLGHSKITVTQEHYAKVVNKKVSEQMSTLSKKLK